MARNDSIAVAHPILAQSGQVSEATLIQIAKTKGQVHLEAVARRPRVNEAVSDLLIERGSDQVIQTVTANGNAKISERGFGTLTERFSGHEKIAVNIAKRQDVPPRVMKALLTKATDTVRTLILSPAPPEKRQAVSDLLRECLKSGGLENAVTSVSAEARNAVYELKEVGELNEARCWILPKRECLARPSSRSRY